MFDYTHMLAAVTPFNILLMFLGVFGGLVVGSMPGLTSTMAVALLVPITFGMDVNQGLVMLVAVYIGSISGGLVSAALLNIPGTPSSVATTFDAYPMVKKGEAGKALGYAVFASFLGGLLSFFALAIIAPLLGKFALRFGPYEYFALVVFTLSCIISISDKSLTKGLISATVGMIMAMVGLSETDSVSRLTFGITDLQSGFSVMPVLIGMYAISQILKDVEEIKNPFKLINVNFTAREFIRVAKLFRHSVKNVVRSSLIGIGVGILPGIGPGLSNIVAYSQAKAASDDPDSFGTGNPDGIIASESANNAATGGAMIPLLTLGIPGDATTMMMLGAFMIHGVQPGPLLMRDHSDLVLIILGAYFVSNIFMMLFQVYFIRVLIRALTIPRYVLYPVILGLCVIGSYALNSSMSDVWVFFATGVLGYIFTRQGFPLLPLVLGLILGGMAENHLRVSLVMGNGSMVGYLHRPIALCFFAAAALSVAYSFYSKYKAKKRAACVPVDEPVTVE
ncbi:tripartite tricarboxylate transporter permease [uncultured Pseudodesulfovibrio sp.]|uniref:tripartite tricarboxylate transporter permease n=1 Tax=uncultured Pseudodesulfovibrio sp. TaxID=2035858 RepID=UPI0029C8D398|nr:tripartite tricarboxylate transporter permease [uncultured Pseudodesulfovibrio sp.]